MVKRKPKPRTQCLSAWCMSFFAAVHEVGLWHEAAVKKCQLLRRLWGLSGHRSAPSIYEYTPQLSRSKKATISPPL